MGPKHLMTWFDRPIAFHRCFVTITGSINAALMLSQMIYWSKITKDPDYWFYKSQKEWEEETGMTRHEQDNARKMLRAKNLIFEKRAGIPATIHFKINFEACFHSLLLSGNLDDAELAKLYAESRQSSSPKNGNLYTETTQENTKDTLSSNDDLFPNNGINTGNSKSSNTEHYYEEKSFKTETQNTRARAKKKVKKPKDEVYTQCVDFWLKDFHTGWTFGAIQGKALKSLINKIRTSSTDLTDATLVATFKKLCQSLPEWFKDKDLQVLDSKFNEIVTQIQQGPKKGWNQMNSAERLFGGY